MYSKTYATLAKYEIRWRHDSPVLDNLERALASEASASSGAIPSASSRSWYTVRQPAACRLIVVCMSSVTVRVSTPPIPTSASRRMSAPDPHQKTAFQRSLPGRIAS